MLNYPCPGRAARAAQSSLIFLVALLTLAAAVRAQQAGAAAPAARQSHAPGREVRLTLTITNKEGHYIGGVGRQNVEVFEGKAARELSHFGPAEEHASVGVLFDISGSMLSWRRGVEAARRAFERFTLQASPQNEYSVWAFNKNVMELTADWTRDATALAEALNKISPEAVTRKGDGGTALYDACAAALDKLSGGSHRRRVLLVFTDGQDNYSRRVRFNDLRRMLRDSEVLMYAFGIIKRPGDPGSLDVGGQALLDELATASGGWAFFPEGSEEMNAVIDRLTVELRHQYLIGFVPADAAKKGELNKVKIRIKPPPGYKDSVRVRSREGYLTPE